MTISGLVGRTVLVVEDHPIIFMDIKRELERAGASVVRGAEHAGDPNLSTAVLDAADEVADRLTERDLPFVFYSGREADTFARWPQAPLLAKPASAEAIVSSLARLLRPMKPREGSTA
jgi:hypothetical protein